MELRLNCLLIVTACFGLVLEFCQLVFESSGGGASFCKGSKDLLAVNKWVSAGFLILFVMLEYVESKTT